MRISHSYRAPLFAFLTFGIVGCSNPLPFGPGRVDITLEQVKVLLVDHATLFPESPKRSGSPDRREALELIISSRTELLGYFAEQNRQIQVRCSVEGNSNGRSYTGFATHAALKTPGSSKPYKYAIYAFIDLKAEDAHYVNGRPATVLDLRTEGFVSLNCYFLGVTKAPVMFPRSNEVVISGSTFRTLLRQSGIE